MIAAEALEQLRAGNTRYLSGHPLHVATGADRRLQVVDNPRPIAIILGCADARVPPELIFDQPLGDLFVVRIAGNIAAPSAVGSIEFAAEAFGPRLVVVLGHTRCGAINATINEMTKKSNLTDDVRFIVDGVRPALEPLFSGGVALDPADLEHHAIHANIHATVEALRYGSPVLQRLAETEGLEVVGAEYSVESGVVEFL